MTSDTQPARRHTATLPLGALAAADDRRAVVEPGRGSVSYADLDRLADRVAWRLEQLGVTPGARIGLYVRRSADAIAAMLGILRAGCAYVPVDSRAPVERVAEILFDCRVQTTFVEQRFEPGYREILEQVGGRGERSLQRLGEVGLGAAMIDWAVNGAGAEAVHRQEDCPSRDLACVLYTSGTTGRSKGWMMSRSAVEAFVAWSHRLLAASGNDVFANHAQFNFAMSLFDIFSSLGCGASLTLVPEEIRSHAPHVATFMAEERVSIWFSSPTILSLIGQLPDLESRDLSVLRVVAFAGEVFPWMQLNALRRRLPHPRYFNFYGSTETNVAIYYEIPPGVDIDGPPPVGRPCEHFETRVVAADGARAEPGIVGELQLRGVGLSAGYWNQPTLTAEKAAPADDDGGPWYRSGDLVLQLPTGDLRYAGRIGRMIKLRGYRVEPGEIEARLYQHPSIKEVGVVPREDDSGLELVAHLTTSTGERIPVVELKEFCAQRLPPYMIPATFEFHASLPRTSTGKIDLPALRAASAHQGEAPAASDGTGGSPSRVLT
jgi:amino acid adenylation domain-containing protein